MGDGREEFWASPDDSLSPEEKRRRQGQEPTQKTHPKKGKPVEIPVPKRGDVMRDLRKVALPAKRPKS